MTAMMKVFKLDVRNKQWMWMQHESAGAVNGAGEASRALGHQHDVHAKD